MAQPQQQYPSRAYSPLQSGAPSHPSFLAPNKRQRLSPGAQSPYNSPSMSNIALPNQVFSSPYYGAQPNGSTTNNSYNTMNPTPQAGAMGPPSRPVDKPTDMNELTDVLLGSGVDLKEEEAALLGRYNSMHQHGDTAFTSGMTTAFNSFGPSVSHISNSAGANMLSSNIPGDRSSFYGAGTFNQPSTPFQTIEERAEIDRKAAYRRKCERWQHHLNDPFLLTGWLQRRISSQAQTIGVSIPHAGLVSTTNVVGKMTELAVAGPDNNEVLTTLKGQSLLPHNSPLVEILALLSLAAEERLSNLIEDAATFAQGRRIGSHGVVPKDLADLAVGAGEYESLAALPTPSNSAVSPKSNPLKRSYESMNKPPTPTSDGNNSPATTIAFPNTIVQSLRDSSRAERTAEEARLMKRARRENQDSQTGETSRSASIAPGTPGSSTSGLLGERAPEVDSKKGTKKEQKKHAEAKATEAQQTAATNKTTNMALGLGGSLGKALSWMQKDVPSGNSKLPALARVNTSTQGLSRSSTTNNVGSSFHLPTGRRHGQFREDKEKGAHIQLRDVVFAMESDRKDKRAMAKTYTRLR